MKLSKFWKNAILVSTLVFTQTALAAAEDEESDKKCIPPKFRDFSPANKAVVPPKSSISFHISSLADPLHVKASAKKIPMKLEVVDKKTFIYVTAKLPDELANGYARIHVEAKAKDGDCVGEDGWLINIESKAPASAASANPTTTTQPTN